MIARSVIAPARNPIAARRQCLARPTTSPRISTILRRSCLRRLADQRPAMLEDIQGALPSCWSYLFEHGNLTGPAVVTALTRNAKAIVKNLGEGSRSVWVGTNVLQDAAALEKDQAADVVVIGSGIAGISIAYELQAAGQDVIIVDRGPIAGGMTSRTTA